MSEGMNEFMKERTNKSMNEWTNERMNERMNEYLTCYHYVGDDHSHISVVKLVAPILLWVFQLLLLMQDV